MWPATVAVAGLAIVVVAAGWRDQPTLTTASYAHQTISSLTGPLLASHPGRSVALAIWIAIGWYLERR